MKYSYLLIFLFLFSCNTSGSNNYKKSSFNSKGFAYIYSKEDYLNKIIKKNSTKHFPAIGEATLSGVMVECDIDTGLANNIAS